MQTHLPGYVNDYAKLTEAGAQVIACVAVNDAYVMKAWAEQSGAEAKVSLTLPSCFTVMKMRIRRSFLPSVFKILCIFVQGIHMLADTQGNLAKALGVELDAAKMLGTTRLKR